MTPRVTLIELIRAVAETASNEAELLLAVIDLINTGQVVLVGAVRSGTLTLTSDDVHSCS